MVQDSCIVSLRHIGSPAAVYSPGEKALRPTKMGQTKWCFGWGIFFHLCPYLCELLVSMLVLWGGLWMFKSDDVSQHRFERRFEWQGSSSDKTQPTNEFNWMFDPKLHHPEGVNDIDIDIIGSNEYRLNLPLMVGFLQLKFESNICPIGSIYGIFTYNWLMFRIM